MNNEAPTNPNPLLQRARIPGRTFTLPSGGVFYKNGELDETARGGEVVVSPMVTIDELTMKTPDKILNGTGLNEVFSRCIPQVKQPNNLLAKDVDFLMVCLRKVTYGDDYPIEYTHVCEGAKKYSYIVALDPLIATAGRLDASRAEGDYMLKLPNEQVVKLNPPKYYQMLHFYQSINENLTEEQLYEQLISTTGSLVETVDGISDRAHIDEWTRAIPAGYTKAIGNKVAALGTWGPKLTTPITCQDCEEQIDLAISLNPMHFFS